MALRVIDSGVWYWRTIRNLKIEAVVKEPLAYSELFDGSEQNQG